jgi:hypothetical protein
VVEVAAELEFLVQKGLQAQRVRWVQQGHRAFKVSKAFRVSLGHKALLVLRGLQEPQELPVLLVQKVIRVSKG